MLVTVLHDDIKLVSMLLEKTRWSCGREEEPVQSVALFLKKSDNRAGCNVFQVKVAAPAICLNICTNILQSVQLQLNKVL